MNRKMKDRSVTIDHGSLLSAPHVVRAAHHSTRYKNHRKQYFVKRDNNIHRQV